MIKASRYLSVSQAAGLCRVGRSTVGYWVRSKKLFAQRQGRSYAIPVEDLLHFLETSGQEIPPELVNGNGLRPVFKSFQNCWQFWGDGGSGHRCGECATFQRQIDDCFCMRADGAVGCPAACHRCRYYQEVYLARFRFIHQLGAPAAVFKGLYFCGGNTAWAELCGVSAEELVGLGVERIVHPSSLADVISTFKQLSLSPRHDLLPRRITITTRQGAARAIETWTMPLSEPEHASLMLARAADP
jgi:excisionase family DNA binding protein